MDLREHFTQEELNKIIDFSDKQEERFCYDCKYGWNSTNGETNCWGCGKEGKITKAKKA